MGGGADFQARVAAWLAAHMLAEEESSPPLDLGSPIEWVACETTDPVDDVVVGSRGGHRAYVQAKRTISLDRSRASAGGKLKPFPSAVDQFVRQFLEPPEPGGAPLNPAHDRLVLAVGGEAPASVRQTLAGVLHRIRIQPEGEPLLGRELNADESQTLQVLLDHVRASWQVAVEREPIDQEMVAFLRFLRVEAIALEEGQAEEREAKRMLRASVLIDPSQAEQAWNTLIQVGFRLIRDRSRVGRSELADLLQREGIRLRPARSYRADIERLQHRSDEVIGRLEEFARITVGESSVRIERPYSRPVRAAVEEGSLLLAGRPGIGKSGVMHELISVLRAEGRDLVVLAAQNVGSTSLGALRADMNLEHEVTEVLDNWPGSEPAFLVIDALDANRDETVRRTLRDLMRAVIRGGGRWRVVASVREYDLRYGVELRELFGGAPPEGPVPPLAGPEFGRVRHVTVSELTDGELDQLEALSPALHKLIESAPAALRELLRNPFNLGLAAELLEGGAEPASIREIRTQMDLLDRYWEVRVIGGGDLRLLDARRSVLRRTVEAMVRSRSLRVDRHVAGGAAESSALAELLTAHVLMEWHQGPGRRPDDSVLAFSHHVLFDYGIERVYLRGTTSIAEHLAGDPQLILLVRPSLVMHFQHLWDVDPTRGEFWEEALAVTSHPEIREIAKIVAPTVVSDRAETAADVEPLLAAREGGGDRRQQGADTALGHTLRALLPGAGGVRPILGSGAGPWSLVVDRVSRGMTRRGAYAIASLLDSVARMDATPTEEQRAHLGAAARRLLSFAWADSPRNGPLVQAALAAVCRYFDTDPAASAALARRSLEKENVSRFGHEEMRTLADAVPTLAPLDPSLVRDIYVRAFTTEVTDKSPTSFGGVVMPFGSNVAQDYGMALYVLERSFASLLRAGPAHAVPAVVQIMRYRARRDIRRRSPRRRDSPHESVETFAFESRTARVRMDHSGNWDSGSARVDDDATKLLDHLESCLRSFAERPDARPQLTRWIRAIVRYNDLALIWTRLLRLGAHYPETLGVQLKPLLFSVPILQGPDTRRAARKFVAAMAAELTEPERRDFERVVLNIEEPEADEPAWLPHIRARLLQSLTPFEPSTPEGRELVAALEAAAAADDLDPQSGSPRMRPAVRTEYQSLTSQGVAVDQPANRRVLELLSPVEKIQSELRNVGSKTPVPTGALYALRSLREALSESTEEVHLYLHEQAQDALNGAAEAVTLLEDVTCGDELGRFLRELLLETAQDPRSKPNPEEPEPEDYPSLASNAPRGAAAEGLLQLAWDASCADSQVLDVIEVLGADPVSGVRYGVAQNLWMLARSAPDRMWDLFERRVVAEENTAVLAALATSAGRIWRSGLERAAMVAVSISTRLEARDAPKRAREVALDTVAGIYVWSGNETAQVRLLEIARDPLRHSDANRLARTFHDMFTRGPTEVPNPAEEAIRGRCVEVFSVLVGSAAPAFLDLVSHDLPVEEVAMAERTRQLRSLAEILNTAAYELYFASGAYRDPDGKKARPSHEQQKRFYREMRGVLGDLAQIGHAPLAHHLLEVLEEVLPFGPKDVFLLIAATVKAATQSGYHYDHQAEMLLGRLIERYLADHREIFQDDEDCRVGLLDVLDVFVGAGSISLQRQAYSLGDIFR